VLGLLTQEEADARNEKCNINCDWKVF